MTHKSGLKYDKQKNTVLLLCWMSLCWVSFSEFCYSECHYSECRYSQCLYSQCHYSECHYSQCLGAFYDGVINFQKEFLFCFLRVATKTYLRAVYISEICRIFLYSENAKHWWCRVCFWPRKGKPVGMLGMDWFNFFVLKDTKMIWNKYLKMFLECFRQQKVANVNEPQEAQKCFIKYDLVRFRESSTVF